jgi:hypothetical protein
VATFTPFLFILYLFDLQYNTLHSEAFGDAFTGSNVCVKLEIRVEEDETRIVPFLQLTLYQFIPQFIPAYLSCHKAM